MSHYSKNCELTSSNAKSTENLYAPYNGEKLLSPCLKIWKNYFIFYEKPKQGRRKAVPTAMKIFQSR